MRSDTEKLGFSLQLKNDDTLNEWSVNLFGFSDCPLAEVSVHLLKNKNNENKILSTVHALLGFVFLVRPT